MIERHEVYAVVRAHLRIRQVLFEERDGHCLIERAEIVWLRVRVGGIQRGGGLREGGILKLAPKVQGHHRDEGDYEEEGAAATEQRIEGFLAFVCELDGHGKHICLADKLETTLHWCNVNVNYYKTTLELHSTIKSAVQWTRPVN